MNHFHHSYSCRLHALIAIQMQDIDALENSANALSELSKDYGRYMPSDELEAFSEALRCIALQYRWINALRNAELDSSRYNTAASLRAKEYANSNNSGKRTVFDDIIQDIGSVETSDDLSQVAKKLLQAQLPFSTSAPRYLNSRTIVNEKPFKPERPEIAFVKFDINGIAAKTIDTLAPNVVHDVALHLRVTNWPSSANALLVEPVSAEPADCYSLPKFRIARPEAVEGPIVLKENNRLILKYAQTLGARPFEFKYRVVFEPSESGSIDLLGHRTLKLESLDPTGQTLSGYASIDTKIGELKKQLISRPGIPDIDLISLVQLLAGVGNIAGQAVQDALFAAGVTEREFQKEVVKMLRAHPHIGSKLEEHPAAGGGFTDLSLNKIRLELKTESRNKITESQLSKYADQAIQYAVASEKRLAVLCVLDSNAKTISPVPVESLFSIIEKQLGGITHYVITIIVQGGLAKPSDLSR